MTTYLREDFRRLSWNEYSETLETLYKKLYEYLQKNSIHIDAIVPILRGGSFPGTFLAYKLHFLTILPVQYKYLIDKDTKKLKVQKLSKISDEAFQTKEDMTFLVVENNHCFGTTARIAIEDIKKLNPTSRILYAAAYMDYSSQDMKDTDVTFYGKLTNETRLLTKEQAEEKGISQDMSLFPWEDLNEEMAMVNEEEFAYK